MFYKLSLKIQSLLCKIHVHNFVDLGDGDKYCDMCGIRKLPAKFNDGSVYNYDKNGSFIKIK